MKMETRPFRSVKEAAELYGKKILEPELYANDLEEIEADQARKHENYLSKIKSVSIELEDAKQNVQKAKDRSMAMAHCLASLQEELEKTKRKLQLLKEQEFQKTDRSDSEIEVVEIVDSREIIEEEDGGIDGDSNSSAQSPIVFWNSPSLAKKTKKKASDKTKKPSISVMAGIFSRKK